MWCGCSGGSVTSLNPVQFAILVIINLAGLIVMATVVVYAVERGLNVRWKSIKLDFDRLFMVSQGLDTLRETLIKEASQSKTEVGRAIEVVRVLKDKFDDHEDRLKDIENHPLLRPIGGGIK